MTTRSDALVTVEEIMERYAEETGLADSARAPRRYLWTDAFAVCNWLELHLETGDGLHLQRARRLIEQVHATLGRHRADDLRNGWISGLSDAEGRAHPTRGGLRIGKGLPERSPGEPCDESLEWERDGQYFHYLTRWMHALARSAAVTCDPNPLHHALELARVAHAAFVHDAPGGGKRMHWKMSIDLTRPQVASMGQHDPLDGLLTYLELHADAARAHEPRGRIALDAEIAELRGLCADREWTTADPLGIGGVLTDAWRLAQLMLRGQSAGGDLLERLLQAAVVGLGAYEHTGDLHAPAARRLAFRELGLSIGLHALTRIAAECNDLEALGLKGAGEVFLIELQRFTPLRDQIEAFWLEPLNQASPSWQSHCDINSVMLATSLLPDGYLTV